MLHELGDKGNSSVESELKKSEELLRAVFNASKDYICVTTIFGEFVEANEAFCRDSGFTREQLLGKSDNASNHWVDLSKRQEFLEILGKNGSVDCFEADMFHGNGQVSKCHLSANVIKVGGAPLVVTTVKYITNSCKGE